MTQDNSTRSARAEREVNEHVISKANERANAGRRALLIGVGTMLAFPSCSPPASWRASPPASARWPS